VFINVKKEFRAWDCKVEANFLVMNFKFSFQKEEYINSKKFNKSWAQFLRPTQPNNIIKIYNH